MSKKNNGGSAFPRIPRQWGNGDTVWGEAGMSLRDYFAAQAMQSYATYVVSAGVGFSGRYPEIAKEAYELADAMIAARNAP